MSKDLNRNYGDFRRLLKEQSGIDIGDAKQTLVESRLSRRLALVNVSDYDEYLKLIKKDDGEMKNFIETMTTNKTDWFREPDHFDFLSKYLLKLVPGRTQPVMIWSAASSTGEEVYSIAMTCEEVGGLNRNYRILGTDINTQVLAKAQNAIYAEDYLLSQIPKQKVKTWFRPASADKKNLQVCNEIRSQVKFRPFNLLESQLPADLLFDVIFLRNVLIYFDSPTIEKVIQRLSKNLRKGGYLLVGHSETLNGIKHPLRHVGNSVYMYE